eukprot:comp22329_c0_seq1/m.53648 comp22329_c0_seq1/g.53648  ORF comp22329_c0_seq1/g.53648 comp22329_c0_seq1/m.53648 type:complete len:377 (-) comp22329_c0_seq1:1530-2660(-)
MQHHSLFAEAHLDTIVAEQLGRSLELLLNVRQIKHKDLIWERVAAVVESEIDPGLWLCKRIAVPRVVLGNRRRHKKVDSASARNSVQERLVRPHQRVRHGCAQNAVLEIRERVHPSCDLVRRIDHKCAPLCWCWRADFNQTVNQQRVVHIEEKGHARVMRQPVDAHNLQLTRRKRKLDKRHGLRHRRTNHGRSMARLGSRKQIQRAPEQILRHLERRARLCLPPQSAAVQHIAVCGILLGLRLIDLVQRLPKRLGAGSQGRDACILGACLPCLRGGCNVERPVAQHIREHRGNIVGAALGADLHAADRGPWLEARALAKVRAVWHGVRELNHALDLADNDDARGHLDVAGIVEENTVAHEHDKLIAPCRAAQRAGK